MKCVNILGVRIDDVSLAEVAVQFDEWLSKAGLRVTVTPNPEFVLLAQHDPQFRSILSRADLALPDGVGLRFAVSALTDTYLRHRTTGVDALLLLAERCAAHGAPLLLLGGADGVAAHAASALHAQYPTLNCCGIFPGDVANDGELSAQVQQEIARFAPAAIAVGLGQGKQERCMDSNREAWSAVRLAIGVGGAFDTLAVAKPRAPRLLRTRGLEWIWRLCIEPRRIGRIFRAFVVFPAVVVSATLREHRFLRACRRTVPLIVRQLTGR